MADQSGTGDVVPLSAEQEAAWRALARAVVVIPRVLDADLIQARGINVTEYTVLMNLSEAPDGCLRMSELANDVAISVSGLTRAVGRLEREGRVERARSSADGRGQVASITPAGMECLREAWPVHLASVRRHVMDHLEGIDLAAFAAAMTAVAWPEDETPVRRRTGRAGDGR
ncbi:MarR family winged helix-turn-helix transcriptional regulator [Aeromicrobium chenweiae]|uniref:MarR family winged helix-turn-helix transcriptional regulator n=1 Tax=Aeromicrobium chenweiae TaxID=2079793 RepID=UPI001F353A74|nr:MarR family winged helix-turn-helix transcriptional regulator [Aeromicrobium chenweiae]